MLIKPKTTKIWLSTSAGKRLEKSDTATLQPARIIAHNNNEPSCAPQTADILNIEGRSVLELLATYLTEKSSTTKAFIKTANETIIQKNCPHNSGFANCANATLFLTMPNIGKETCSSAKTKAKTNAKCPISTNIKIYSSNKSTILSNPPKLMTIFACLITEGFA